MASAQLLLNVSYRGIPLYTPVVMREVDSSKGFLETSSPMPVGTMLTLSPVENATIKVPARVAAVVEGCRATSSPAVRPGMNLVFEAAGESLLPYLQTEPEASTASTSPGFASPSPAESAQAPEPQPPEPESAAPKVVVDEQQIADVGETVELEADYETGEGEGNGNGEDEGLLATASGEIDTGSDGEDKNKKKKKTRARSSRRKKK